MVCFVTVQTLLKKNAKLGAPDESAVTSGTLTSVAWAVCALQW